MRLFNILSVLFVAAAMGLAANESLAGGDGHGGGGVIKDGVFMTFYSAGFWVPPSYKGSIAQPPI